MKNSKSQNLTRASAAEKAPESQAALTIPTDNTNAVHAHITCDKYEYCGGECVNVILDLFINIDSIISSIVLSVSSTMQYRVKHGPIVRIGSSIHKLNGTITGNRKTILSESFVLGRDMQLKKGHYALPIRFNLPENLPANSSCASLSSTYNILNHFVLGITYPGAAPIVYPIQIHIRPRLDIPIEPKIRIAQLDVKGCMYDDELKVKLGLRKNVFNYGDRVDLICSIINKTAFHQNYIFVGLRQMLVYKVQKEYIVEDETILAYKVPLKVEKNKNVLPVQLSFNLVSPYLNPMNSSFSNGVIELTYVIDVGMKFESHIVSEAVSIPIIILLQRIDNNIAPKTFHTTPIVLDSVESKLSDINEISSVKNKLVDNLWYHEKEDENTDDIEVNNIFNNDFWNPKVIIDISKYPYRIKAKRGSTALGLTAVDL